MASLPLLLISLACATPAGASWREQLDQAEKLSQKDGSAEAAAAAQGALDEAGKRLDSKGPEIGDVLARVARVYETAGAAERIPEIEERLLAIPSKDFEAWSALGRLLRGDRKLAAAEEALKRALALKPGDPEAGNELSRVYEDMGRLEEEARLLKILIAEEPRDYSLYSRLARAEFSLGRPAQAREVFAKARKIEGKSSAAYIEEGYFLLESGDAARAKGNFENAVAVDTASPLGYHHLGAYLSDSDRNPEAEGYLREALKKLQADPSARNDDLLHTMKRLGDALKGQGRDAEAEAVYLEGLRRARPNDDRHLRILRALAKLYLAQGKNSQAEETFKRAVSECAPRRRCQILYAGDAFIDLGKYYLRRGRRSEAEGMAEKAESLCADAPISPGLIEVLERLALFYAKLEEDSKREAIYSRLLPLRKSMPFNPYLVWVEAGMAEQAAARGRPREAESLYRRAVEILDHNGWRQEQAEMLETLAELDMNDDPRAAAQDRERANALRVPTPR
jgi:tetratricopeptide (TPR) repeat protein